MPIVPQTNYSIYTAYYWDYGLRGVPICGPPGTPLQVVAEHAPTCHKVVSWMAQAQDGMDPQAPDWQTNSSASPTNEVLVHKAISAPFNYDLGDGTFLTTIAGVYVYLCLVPPSDTDGLVMSQPPWDATLRNVIYPSNFFQGLLGMISPNPTGGYAGMPGSPQPVPIQKPPPVGNQNLNDFFIEQV